MYVTGKSKKTVVLGMKCCHKQLLGGWLQAERTTDSVTGKQFAVNEGSGG